MGWWPKFREINKTFLHLKAEDFSYFSLLAVLVVVAALWGIFSSAYFRFCRLIVACLIDDSALKAKVIDAIPLFSHLGVVRILFGLCALIMVYVLLFIFHAPRAMILQTQSSDRRVQELEMEKRQLVNTADYRDQLAAAVGLRFVSVSVYAQIRNLSGDCTITQEEVFKVSDLGLRDLVRRRLSRCAQKREKPAIWVTGLDQTGTFSSEFEDQAPTRQYHIYFDPPLRNTTRDVRLTITEDIEKLFIMARDEFPAGWWTKEPKERAAQIIMEPTDTLTLRVDFPVGYPIPPEQLYLAVSYGRTHTHHITEEQRLTVDRALRVDRLPSGAVRANLVAEKPLLGLTYMLCWQPLEGQEVKELREKTIAREKPS